MPDLRIRSFRRFRPLCAAPALLPLFSLPAFAAEPAAPLLDPVVVTATRTPQPLSRRLSDVTVISREDILRSGHTSLIRLLQQQHGVEVTTTGGPQTSSGVMIRGANSGHTLCLVDGLRVGSVTLGQPSFNGIPLSQIERIEILRGPASSLYGADAIGGVVNIVTRKGGGPLRLNGSLGAGRWNTLQGALGFDGEAGPVEFGLQTGYERSDGYNTMTDPGNGSYNPDRDGYDRRSLSGRLAWTWAEEHTLTLRLLRSWLNAQYDQTGTDWSTGRKFYGDDRIKLRTGTLALTSVDRLGEGWLSRLNLGEGTDHATAVAYSGSYIVSKQRQFGWQHELSFGERHALTLGYEHLREKAESTAYTRPGTPNERRTDSLVGVYQLRYEPFSLQLNGRGDRSSQYGNETTGALLLGWRALQPLRLTAQYGTGFKAPSFNDLYWPNYGNPDIRPESSRNTEIGAHYRAGGVTASLTAYRNRVRDLIIYNAGCTRYAPIRGCADNINRARLEGLSLSYEHRIDGTTMTLNGDWQNPVDEASGRLAPRRAKRHGLFALSQILGPLTAGAELEASGRRFDDTANKKPLGGYALFNLHASYDLTDSWRLVARWNNVLNKRYELSQGYATPASNLFVAVQYEQR